MAISVSPSEFDILSAMRAFLLQVLPTGTEVIRAYANRVPEPKTANFVLMIPLRKQRLETNIDNYVDTRFIGSIEDDVMTVTELTYGTISVGSILFGEDMISGTTVTGTTAGGYTITPTQTLSSRVMAAGVMNAVQPVQVTIQLDVHGPLSGDNSHIISTLFRDDYAYQFLYEINPSISPLYADDPRLIPFVNAESQYEYRWIVEANLEAQQVVWNIPLQFAEELNITTIAADAYPIK